MAEVRPPPGFEGRDGEGVVWDPPILVKPVEPQPGATRQGRAGAVLSVGTDQESKEQGLLTHYVSSIL